MNGVLGKYFLVLSLDLNCPFGVVDVVCGEGSVVFLGGVGFGEAYGAVVGSISVPVECGAVEAMVDLVEGVVVDVEAVEFGGGGGVFVGMVWLVAFRKCMWVKNGLLEKVGLTCVLRSGGVEIGEVDAVCVVLCSTKLKSPVKMVVCVCCGRILRPILPCSIERSWLWSCPDWW